MSENGKDVSDKGGEILSGHVVVHEQREKLAENVSDHEDETQHEDRKQNVHDQLAADEAVD